MKGVDPKFRRNHKYALHGTMIALVCVEYVEFKLPEWG